MIPDNRWEAEDKAALDAALIALNTCPKCRRELRPAIYYEDFGTRVDNTLLGCVSCDRTYPNPKAR